MTSLTGLLVTSSPRSRQLKRASRTLFCSATKSSSGPCGMSADRRPIHLTKETDGIHEK